MPSPRRTDASRSEPSREARGSQGGRDAGAYIGRLPEREIETIPDGLGAKDKRVAAVATQPGPVRGPQPADLTGQPPAGHRDTESANSDRRREAGENR